MAVGRIPGSLGLLWPSTLPSQAVRSPGTIVGTAGPLAAPAPLSTAGAGPFRGPGPLSTARLIGLTVVHGARKSPQHAGQWESYLFKNESVIVRARTDPDSRSAWSQIQWHCTGGKPITGFGNGWSIPRSQLRTFRVSASLGGVTYELTVSIHTLVDIWSSSANESPGGTPLNPLGTGRKINLYGFHEAKGFEDYAALKEYQTEQGYVRKLTKAPVNAPPPDGPGLPDNCASDICMRGSPIFSPSYYAMNRIRKKDRCRITFCSGAADNQRFLDAFSDASHIQCWPTDTGSLAHVIEYPREAVWSSASDVPEPVVPPPDPGFLAPRKIRAHEGED